MRIKQSVLRKFISCRNMRTTQTCNGPPNMKSPLRQVREKSGQTIVEVCRAIDIDQGNLSRIENGKQRPSTEVAEKLARHFNNDITEMEILYPERYCDSDASDS